MFDRGFKSWCETVAVQQRKNLDLQPTDPLDPWDLAKSVGVLVWSADQIPGIGVATLNALTKDDPTSWSAATVCLDSRNLVILNPTHSPARTRSNLTHELSHVLVGHDPARIDVDPNGQLMLRTYNKKQEGEADWLAGCLLLPRSALIHIRRKRMDHGSAKKLYGVSEDMLNYRLRMTGVDRQLNRARQSK